MDLVALVAPLRRDTTSGASLLGLRAARLVEQLAHDARVGSASELVDLLEELALGLLEAQPAMATLVSLCREVLLSLEDGEARGGSLDDARRVAAAAARGFAETVEDGVREVAARAASQLPRDRPILTLSSSGTVRETLRAAAGPEGLEVICLESRPFCEGRAMAGELARSGFTVTYAVDAALESLLPRCGAVLLGADSVGDLGIVNKIGSLAAARAARAREIPVLVVVDRSKLLPPGFPQLLQHDRPPQEVWAPPDAGEPPSREARRGGAGGPPEGLRVWNRYFEAVDASLVHRVVTQQGVWDSHELEARREGLGLPAALRRWLETRA